MIHRTRFNLMSEARIWYTRHTGQDIMPAELQNEIVSVRSSSGKLWTSHSYGYMEAAKALSCSPAALDLCTWLSYRYFIATAVNAGRPLGRAAL
jgi:hypothetical protein